MARQPGRPKVVPDEAISALYDPHNPDALLNRLPPRLVPILERVRNKLPRTLMLTEREIRTQCQPDERDERVRLSFWDEYNAATASGKKMALQSIICGAVSWEMWVSGYEPNNKRMLWIFTPPVSYAIQMRHILHKGTERLLEIMNLPMLGEDGKVDTKVATLILKAWQLADMRIKGGIVQRMQVEQKSVNVNFNSEQPVDQLREQVSGLQLEDLETLERRIEKAKRDQHRYLKHYDGHIKSLIKSGDQEILDDVETVTRHGQRMMMPDIPELPDIELKFEEVTDGQEEAEPRRAH
jgi:hypothetical protein